MIGVIALSLILIVSCAKLLPSENVNVQNSSCPENQKMSYEFSGAGYDETGCKDIAPDAGKICQNNDDCINNCFVTQEELKIFGCETVDCFEQKECSGIKGHCEEILGEAQITLPTTNTISSFCDE